MRLLVPFSAMSDEDPMPPRVERDARAAFSIATPKQPLSGIVLAWANEVGLEEAYAFTRAAVEGSLGGRRAGPVEHLVFDGVRASQFVAEFIEVALVHGDGRKLNHYLQCFRMLTLRGGYIVAAMAPVVDETTN